MRKLILMTVALIGTACTIDDADRCYGDYEWSEENQLCLMPDSDTGQDEGLDSQSNGVGVACHSPQDCADFEADFCLDNPQNPADPGMCTVRPCVPSDCTGPFQCCDCTGQESEFIDTTMPFCVPDENVALLTTVFTCVCE